MQVEPQAHRSGGTAACTHAGLARTLIPAAPCPLAPQDDSLGWMELRFAAEPVNYGDHDVVICEVTDWHTPAAAAAAAAGSAAQQPLYTGRLKELGLLP